MLPNAQCFQRGKNMCRLIALLYLYAQQQKFEENRMEMETGWNKLYCPNPCSCHPRESDHYKNIEISPKWGKFVWIGLHMHKSHHPLTVTLGGGWGWQLYLKHHPRGGGGMETQNWPPKLHYFDPGNNPLGHLGYIEARSAAWRGGNVSSILNYGPDVWRSLRQRLLFRGGGWIHVRNVSWSSKSHGAFSGSTQSKSSSTARARRGFS